MSKQNITILVSFVLIALGVTVAGCGPTDEQIATAYERVNSTFRMGEVGHFVDPADEFPVLDDGTPVNVMLVALRFNQQRWRAGLSVEPREIARFFENEFEPDGSRRLYNNGRHRDVQMIVEWFNAGDRAFREMGMRSFLELLDHIYSEELRDALDGAEVINPDFPTTLAQVNQAEVWLALWYNYREFTPPDLRGILEPIYGWPEP